MKTIESGYPKHMSDLGGFPEEYPFCRPFDEHIEYVRDLFLSIDNVHSEAELFYRMNRYYNMGFEAFANACFNTYKKAKGWNNDGY